MNHAKNIFNKLDEAQNGVFGDVTIILTADEAFLLRSEMLILIRDAKDRGDDGPKLFTIMPTHHNDKTVK